LLIACVHLVAHHRVEPLLLWLHDIARIVDTLDDSDSKRFVEAAAATRSTTVCASALDAARRHFDGPALASLAERVRASGAGRVEPSARLLTATRPIDDLWLDFRIANGWRERATLLREHLWPDPEYMRGMPAGRHSLALAYLRRALVGARKWIAPGVM
jgi:hypothetical protein